MGRFRLHPSFMCAGGVPGKGTCTGDGGGPLMCSSYEDPDTYEQAGIVAWGIGCGDQHLECMLLSARQSAGLIWSPHARQKTMEDNFLTLDIWPRNVALGYQTLNEDYRHFLTVSEQFLKELTILTNVLFVMRNQPILISQTLLESKKQEDNYRYRTK